MVDKIVTDVLVVGSGAAGLCAAIAARQGNAETLIASITSPGAGNTTAVAGGLINAAIAADDSPGLHFQDTVRAGLHINDRPLVANMVEAMPRWLPRLEECGVEFLKEEGEYVPSRSPGHTRARTLQFRPRIGLSLSRPLAETARRMGAKVLHDFNIVKILVHHDCAVGAIGYRWDTDEIVHVAAGAVVLATGGASLVYRRTRIPPGVPGDGYGIALDAGLTLQDMEFVQFYPTVCAEPGEAKWMIGYDYWLKAGAVFRNALGEDIVAKHGLPEPELITRDQLSIAIGREIYEGRGIEGTVLMDTSECQRNLESTLYRDSAFVRLVRERWAKGQDRLAGNVLVAPANHSYMGGIQTIVTGETSVEALLACGEVAGGAHGANRLQGNSLSEAVVAGSEAGRTAAIIARSSRSRVSEKAVSETAQRLRDALRRQSGTPVREILRALQSTMTAKAALVRDQQGLQEARAAIDELRHEIPRAMAIAPRDRSLLCTLPQLLDTAECIVLSALARRESRGAHYRCDHPERDDRAWVTHITCTKRGGQIATATSPVRR